jgi:hypothetical protein
MRSYDPKGRKRGDLQHGDKKDAEVGKEAGQREAVGQGSAAGLRRRRDSDEWVRSFGFCPLKLRSQRSARKETTEMATKKAPKSGKKLGTVKSLTRRPLGGGI